MTIDSQYSSELFFADTGPTPEYTFTFELIEANDIRVDFLDSEDNSSLVPSNTYTVTIDTSQPTAQGGTISFAAPHDASVVKVLVSRRTDITQLIDYAPYTPFPADTHEAALDKLTMIAQENADRLDVLESLGPPEGSELGNLETISVVLEDGQTVVAFPANARVDYGAFYIEGYGADNGRLVDGKNYNVNFESNTVTLVESYPAGTRLTMAFYDTPGGSRAITQPFVVTVGTGGDFGTINEALSYLQYFYRDVTLYGQPAIEIRLLSGFVMEEQVVCDGISLTWLIITSEDAEVTIRRSALGPIGIPFLDYDSAPAFLAVNNGHLPIISTIFTMDGSGDPSFDPDRNRWHGVMVAWGGRVVVNRDCGVKNAYARGLYGVNGYAYARHSIWDGCWVGIRPANASLFNVRDSHAEDCGLYGLYVGMSVVNANFINVSRAGSQNLRMISNSIVSFKEAIATDAGTNAIEIDESGVVYAEGADLSRAANRGIISFGGKVDAHDAIINDCGDSAVVGNRGADITVTGGELLRCGDLPVGSYTGSRINVANCKISRVAGDNFVDCSQGGFVTATGILDEADNPILPVLPVDVIPNMVNDTDGIVVTDHVTRSPEGQTATVLGGTSSVTVAHGLYKAPTTSGIHIMPVNTEAGSSSWRIGNVTATTFDININPAPVGDATFAWSARVLPRAP